MVLMDPIPGEEHKKVSADYVKCLSKVSVPHLIITSTEFQGELEFVHQKYQKYRYFLNQLLNMYFPFM